MIEVQALCKSFAIQERSGNFVKDFFSPNYYTKEAVKNLSFNIDEGEIVGYIGKNGAGKSTTIKMLSGILYPTSGQVVVNGVIPYQDRVQNAKNMGVVFGQRTQLWWDIPIGDTFKLLKEMYRIPDETYQETYGMLNEILNLEALADYAVRQLSLGQRMRADLACAMIHRPKVLFLDEPTIGLDIVMKRQIRAFIKEINQLNQTTILLTTHDMHDIERLCHRIIIIDQGQLFFDGAKQKLYTEYDKYKILRITTDQTLALAHDFKVGLLKEAVIDVQEGNEFCRILFDSEKMLPPRLIEHIQKQFSVEYEAMSIEKMNIEEITGMILSSA